jgi:hypothetical protein
VGDESKIWFGQDLRVGDMTLKEAFSMLFSIAHFKEALIVDHMQISNGTCL